MTERPDGYDALPKRFKDYIQKLESKVDALRQAQPSRTVTKVKVCNTHDKEAEQYLPDAVKVEFVVGSERFQVQRSEDGLEVRGEWGGLAVLPNVSNSITVIPRPRQTAGDA